MDFHPAEYIGRPLPELLSSLGGMKAEEVWAESAGKVEFFGPGDTADLVTRRPSTLMTTVVSTSLPPDHPDIDLPDVVLESYLGGGGQGWVYVGRVIASGSRVAVKVLRSEYVKAQGWAAREALLCSRIRHRNVLRVFGARPAGNFWVVLMELVQGSELGAAPLMLPQAKACFAQVADALRLLCEQKIVHCDVKPANILLRDAEGSPVLVDFGIAVDLATFNQKQARLSGTPLFIPPEVFATGVPHPAWDAYALGVTAAVALVGKVEGYSDLTTLREAKLSGEFDRKVEQLVQHLEDDGMRDWVRALIHREPEQRIAALEAARSWLAA